MIKLNIIKNSLHFHGKSMNTSVYFEEWWNVAMMVFFFWFLWSLNHHLPKKIIVQQKSKSLSSPWEFNVFLMSSVHHHIVRQKKRMLVQTQIKMASLVSILPGRVVSIVLNSWTVSGFISFSTITIYKSADSRLYKFPGLWNKTETWVLYLITLIFFQSNNCSLFPAVFPIVVLS